MKIMEYRKSIKKIHKEYSTNGSRPVEVLCDDFENYICKYGSPPAEALGREYLASQFLKLWGIKTPQAAFVRIDPEHVPNTLSDRAQPRHFRVPTFGVRKHNYAKEVDASFEGFTEHIIRQIDRRDLLKIALFDLWVGNEDRHQGNFNLMVDSGTDGENPYFMPIDHSLIFNSGNTEFEITLLTFDETLINTNLFKHFCRMSGKVQKEVDEIAESLESWKNVCRDHLDDILNTMPQSWGIDTFALNTYLQNNIFNPIWLKQVQQHFRIYIQESLS
ncbi:MAG: HipA family kinase [Bacteroidia bacterium]|nr:HipA family kinase [Bacteroidia bacterium]